jgi:transcriptional regulator with XRE-family HTH domain
MAKDAKSKDGKSDDERTIWLVDDLGERWRQMREARGFTTRTLATRIGTSSGTISNVETGKQRTLERGLYARWMRAISKEQPSIPDELWEQLVAVFVDADDEEAKKLIQLAPIIKKPRTR